MWPSDDMAKKIPLKKILFSTHNFGHTRTKTAGSDRELNSTWRFSSPMHVPEPTSLRNSDLQTFGNGLQRYNTEERFRFHHPSTTRYSDRQIIKAVSPGRSKGKT